MQNELARMVEPPQKESELVTVPIGLTPTMPRLLMTTEQPQSRVQWELRGWRPGR